jgi:quinoprotein glucose dehydrogenase
MAALSRGQRSGFRTPLRKPGFMAPVVLTLALGIVTFLNGADDQGPARSNDRSSISDAEWPFYGRDPGGTKYSPLANINRRNVQNLKQAWIYRTGDLLYRTDSSGAQPAHEATPLFVGERLYLSTPFGRVIALNPETGIPLWTYDPKIDLKSDYSDFADRGVSYWRDSRQRQGSFCAERIFDATIDARLIALDAMTGKPCPDFGDRGQVNLLHGLRNGPEYNGEYQVTSPPAVIHDLVVVGSAVADNNRAYAPSGEVRAFDARTGKLRWSWDPIPQRPGDPGAETWKGDSARRTGGANAWSIISVDAERNLVFVPTGSASPDYYGGLRRGNNLFANSVVALAADTGRLVWHFQTVHHDLWDYDMASQPLLFTWRRDGRDIPAVAVGSKTGNLFLLNRETGKPIFGVEERPVPKSDVPGEEASPTQPFPVLPRPLIPQRLTSDDAWGATPEDKRWCAEKIRALRSEGIFTPPSLRGSIVFPGNIGGMHWGGSAFDPLSNLLFIPTNRLAAVVKLIPHQEFAKEKAAHPELQTTEQKGAPYSMSRGFLLNSNGRPCNAPPWGVLAAVEVTTGKVKWEVPLGVNPSQAAMPQATEWGSSNMGGPMVTAGGLVFIAATLDGNLRAFDTETGRELWKAKLPTAGRATPMTYRARNGKQYIVITAGGRNATTAPQGDYIVAFDLP